MSERAQDDGETLAVAPYFDVLLQRIRAGEERARVAFGRHVHWGCWPDPDRADGTPADYAEAAERLCRKVCDAAGIRDGMRILDVGCGLGGTIASLNERFHDLDMTGVNIDARQLRVASENVRPLNGNRIRFLEADACSLPFPPGSFDVVLAVECIFHFPSRSAFLREAASVLIPGGRLALSDFVPPMEAVPQLVKFGTGQDEETKASYGQVDLLCPLEQYYQFADDVRLVCGPSEDITVQTMPTYEFLRADQRIWPDRRAARCHTRATTRLEHACRLGLLRYTVLSFSKAAVAAAA